MKVLQAYVRVYVRDLNTSRPFYEQLLGEAASAQFTYEAAGLEQAVIGPILTLAGTDQVLAPFRETPSMAEWLWAEPARLVTSTSKHRARHNRSSRISAAAKPVGLAGVAPRTATAPCHCPGVLDG